MELLIYEDILLRCDGVKIKNDTLTIMHLESQKYVEFNFYRLPTLCKNGTQLVSSPEINWDSKETGDGLYALLYSGKEAPSDVSMNIKDKEKVSVIKEFEFYTIVPDWGYTLDKIYLVQLHLKVNESISFYMASRDFKWGECYCLNVKKTNKKTEVEGYRYDVSKKEWVIHLSNL